MSQALITLLSGVQPAKSAAAVTPNDSVDLPGGTTRGIIVGVSGNVAVTMKDGTSVTLPALAAGIVHPFAVKRIKSTNTTATSIIAVY